VNSHAGASLKYKQAMVANEGPRLLVALFGPLSQCPRAHRYLHHAERRCVEVLSERGGSVWLVEPGRSFKNRVYNFLLLLLGRYERYLSRRYRLVKLRSAKFDAILCHDLLLVPSLLGEFKDARLVVDLREYYPGQEKNHLFWRLTFGRLNRYICKTYLPGTAALATVSDSLANVYGLEFGLSVSVIPSYAAYHDLPIRPVNVPVRLVYMGNASRSRKIHNLVHAMAHVGDAFVLDLYLMEKERSYFRKIQRIVASGTNVRILPPVPFSEIVNTLNAYDIGVLCLPEGHVNFDVAMPNKLFEYVQARLMVLSPPRRAVGKFVEGHGLGVRLSGDEVATVVETLVKLDAGTISTFKGAADRFARKHTAVHSAELFDQLLFSSAT